MAASDNGDDERQQWTPPPLWEEGPKQEFAAVVFTDGAVKLEPDQHGDIQHGAAMTTWRRAPPYPNSPRAGGKL